MKSIQRVGFRSNWYRAPLLWMSRLLQTSLGVQADWCQLLVTFAPKTCICIFSERNISQAKCLSSWKRVNMSRVKSYSHLTSFSRPIPGPGPCCSSSESLLHMHATHSHLINGSLEPKDVVFLISLEIADRCRKYGVALLRRILLCAICSFYPGQKGAQYIQLREALALCVLGARLCPLSLSRRAAPTRSASPDTAAPPRTSAPQISRSFTRGIWAPVEEE